MPLAVSAMWPATFPAAPAVEMPRSMPLPDEGNPGMFEEEEPTGNPVGYGVGYGDGYGVELEPPLPPLEEVPSEYPARRRSTTGK